MSSVAKRYRTVADLMRTDVVRITPEATVAQLAALLSREGVSAVPVVDSGGHPIGVASASDLLWLCDTLLDPAAAAQAKSRTVGEVMTPDVFSVESSAGLDKLCLFFQRTGVHRALVMDRGTLVGIVSLTDLLGLLADEPPTAA
jgi:CBS domain-containing protein